MSRDADGEDGEEWLDDPPASFELDDEDDDSDDDSGGGFTQEGPAVDPFSDDGSE